MSSFNDMVRGISYKRKLSKRIVLAYTSIILVPLLIMFSLIFSFFRDQTIDGLNQIAKLSVDDNVSKLEESRLKINLIEKMVNANEPLMLYLTVPGNYSEQDTISIIKSETESLERILSIEPSLYAIRVFADNDIVPERFPVILNSSRTNLWDLSEFEYDYKAEFLANLNAQMEPSVCFTTRLSNKGKREIGYLQISMKMESYFPFLYKEENLHENDFAFKVRKENGKYKLTQIWNDSTILYNPIAEEPEIAELEKAMNDANGKKGGSLMLSVMNQKYTAYWHYLSSEDIVLAHTCSTEIIFRNEMRIAFFAIMGLFIVFAALFFLIKYLTSYLLSGVYSLMDGMNEVKKGRYDLSLDVSSDDDVGEALQTFNVMTATLQNQINQITTEQQIIADTEMKAMQNQINAHFLYNVLETIHMQAVLSENEEIAESILVLGKMMRYCLRWRVHSVTLNQEMEYISSYIYILNLRNDYEIKLETAIPEDIENFMIPKMLLQPFVENAFFHAIEPVAKDSTIKISAEVDEANNKLWLCVQDYGAGITKQKLDEIMAYLEDEKYERDSTGSIGVKNIQQRLRVFYGPDYKLVIQSECGKGTTIKVPVPLKAEKNG